MTSFDNNKVIIIVVVNIRNPCKNGGVFKKYGIRILKDIYNQIKKLIKDIKLTHAKARDTSLFV